MMNYIKLIRIKHWIKNGLIFLPIFFSQSFTKENIISTIVAFFAFSFMASTIYIINDIKDVKKDRNHPKKKNRPIASGKVTIPNAIILAILLFISSIILNYFATKVLFTSALICLLAYLVINLFYSFGAKDIPILDIAILATGFILRVYYGAFIINVPVSNWLFLTILSASLFMGLGKRKKELKIKEEVRKVLKEYNENFLNSFMNICLGLLIVFYSLWTMEQNISYLFLSIPMLIIILMQYMLYMENSDEGDPITILFQSKPLIVSVLIYLIFMILVMVVL